MKKYITGYTDMINKKNIDVLKHKRYTKVKPRYERKKKTKIIYQTVIYNREPSIINIPPLVEGVMVDDHTREKISHSVKRISPSTSSRVIFFFQSVIFFPECGHLP
jgi:hypothetical protein